MCLVGYVFTVRLWILEPVGSTPPRLPPKAKLGAVIGICDHPVVLACDAQANPNPMFRWGALCYNNHHSYVTITTIVMLQ
jgi:hypothetical protein